MHRFYLMIRPAGHAVAERIALDASDGDHALHLAESHARDGDVELWEGERMIAKMAASTPRLWSLQPAPSGIASAVATVKGGKGR